MAFISITSVEENQDFEEAKVIIRDPKGYDHECSAELLERILGPEYAPIVLKKSPEGVPLKQAQEIVLAELQEEIDEPMTVPVQTEEEEKQENSADRMPEFVRDGRYKDDVQGRKTWDTFVYNHHALSISYRGNEGTIHFYVYPLAMRQNALSTDIFVIAESGEVCRAGVSHGEVSSVELNFGEIPFVVRGSFKDGQFQSIVKPMIQEVLDTAQENIYEHPAKVRTSSTYVQTEYHGVPINIFPAKWKKDEYGDYVPENGSSGYVPAGIVIGRENHVEVFTPTSEGVFNILGNDGEKILVSTYWNHKGDDYIFRYDFE